MWIYKIKQKINKHGFYDTPENCTNAKFGNFDELLKSDDHKLVKSAIVNWFSNNDKSFFISMNGIDSIYLQSDVLMEEYYFQNFNVINWYLIQHSNQEEYQSVLLLNRYKKIKKIKTKWLENQL